MFEVLLMDASVCVQRVAILYHFCLMSCRQLNHVLALLNVCVRLCGSAVQQQSGDWPERLASDKLSVKIGSSLLWVVTISVHTLQ